MGDLFGVVTAAAYDMLMPIRRLPVSAPSPQRSGLREPAPSVNSPSIVDTCDWLATQPGLALIASSLTVVLAGQMMIVESGWCSDGRPVHDAVTAEVRSAVRTCF